MKPYVRIYIESLGLDKSEPIYSELSGKIANDIHHIEARGIGGTSNPERNSIFNLIALTRDEHEKYGDKVKHKRWLKVKHLRLITQRGARLLGIYQEVDFKPNEIIFKGEDDTG